MQKRYTVTLILFSVVALFGCASLIGAVFLVNEYGDPTNGRSAIGPVKYISAVEADYQPIPNLPSEVESEIVDLNKLVDETSTSNRLGVVVNTAVFSHQISPFIYGINFSDYNTLDEMNVTLRRWGGNATTRFNWKTDVSNRGSDWFFENIPNDTVDRSILPESSSADLFIGETLELGIDPIMTLPLIGWTPNGVEAACGFPISVYGDQQLEDPFRPECGNGISNGGQLLPVQDVGLISDPIEPEFVAEWLKFMISRHGAADTQGVRFYNLDNEPMLWHITHRDVHPDPVNYDEIKAATVAYGSAIKAVDPAAQTLGPVLYGWSGYFYSANDLIDGSGRFNNPDRKAHGNQPFVEWYLQQMQEHESQTGVRILDYLDLHYYSEVPNVSLSNDLSPETRQRRFNATRSLWDPTYRDESWINEPIQLIPRMHDWVNESYPGTGTAITEYNFGALDHITGALVQADALGIFGREQLDIATLWDPPTLDQPGAFAFKIFRNYDGQNSTFGDLSLPAGTLDQSRVAVYAAHRLTDGAITIILINKNNIVEPVSLHLAGRQLTGSPFEHYQYSALNLDEIVQVQADQITTVPLELTLDPESINLIVVQP